MPKGHLSARITKPGRYFLLPLLRLEHGVLEGLFGLEQLWHGSGYGINWAGGTSGVSVPPSCPKQDQLHQPLNPPWGQTFHLMATTTSTTGKEVFFGIFLKLLSYIYLSLTSLQISENLVLQSDSTLPLIFLSTCHEGVCRNLVN